MGTNFNTDKPIAYEEQHENAWKAMQPKASNDYLHTSSNCLQYHQTPQQFSTPPTTASFDILSVSRPGQILYDLVKIRRAKTVATVALTH